MNAALTRCRRGVIIIGNRDTFASNKLFEEYFEFVAKNGLIMSPISFYSLPLALNEFPLFFKIFRGLLYFVVTRA